MSKAIAVASAKMDKELKENTERIFKSMGLTATTAITLFYKAVSMQNKIPFEIVGDPFYSPENMLRLQKSIHQLETTGGTPHELIEVDDD